MSNLSDFLEQLGREDSNDSEQYPCPCTGCPEFESYVYPSTPDHPEEYDTFCGAVEEGLLSDSIFLRFMEMQHERDEACPYRVYVKKLEAIESLACAVEQLDFPESMEEGSPMWLVKAALDMYRELCVKEENDENTR